MQPTTVILSRSVSYWFQYFHFSRGLPSAEIVQNGSPTSQLVQICVWSTGNAARPIVQAISAQIPEQRATMEGRNPATTKLAVDPFLRIDGAMDAIALGDCSRMTGGPLPATAQVRSACRAFF